MRIALATWTDRRAGGVETYVESVAAALAALGHDIALLHETTRPPGRAAMELPPGATRVWLGDGIPSVLAWKPDVLVLNGLQDASLEAALLERVPSVVVVHNLNHTCISGRKAWSFPDARPCSRTLGWPCLLHYFPHRCGGLSPVTMVRLYRQKQDMLGQLRGAKTVVTLSAYMRDELLRHHFDPSRVVSVPYGPQVTKAGTEPDRRLPASGPVRHLITVARLERLKGAHLLIDALPRVLRDTGQSISLTIVGEGPERGRLEAQAQRVVSGETRLTVQFTGWVTPAERDRHLRSAHLLVVPSVLPESLGLVGLEAAAMSVPAVAFDVGGVRQWLIDGRTGVLAPADPPAADGLARAIARCLNDDTTLDLMSKRAREHAASLSPAQHARGLLDLLEAVAPARRPGTPA